MASFFASARASATSAREPVAAAFVDLGSHQCLFMGGLGVLLANVLVVALLVVAHFLGYVIVAVGLGLLGLGHRLLRAVAAGFGLGLGHIAVALGLGLANVLGVGLHAIALGGGSLVVRVSLLHRGVIVCFGSSSRRLCQGKTCRGCNHHRTHCCGQPFLHHVELLSEELRNGTHERPAATLATPYVQSRLGGK